jgi:predicted dehydrogenase
MPNHMISRRQFAAGTAAGITFLPRQVLGGKGYASPNDKLNIAAIGAGGMGRSNLQRCSGENIVALCDVDDARAERTYQMFPQAPRYHDFRIMLERQKDIDAVIIATPDHSHAAAAMAAMWLGKHVYVQKPMARTVGETRVLTEAARHYKIATQMGNQGHSGEGVRLICEWIGAGAIGPVREVHCWTDRPVWPQALSRPCDAPPVPASLDWDLWLGPALERPYHPTYLPFKWRAWLDFGCGALGDMGCHIMDAPFTALQLGYPSSVEACVAETVVEMWKKQENKDTFPLASIVHYEFPSRPGKPGLKLHWYDGGLRPQRPAELEPDRDLPMGDGGGTMFVGDEGILTCGTYGDSPRLVPETRMQHFERPPKSLPRVKGSHEQNWIDACKGAEPACSSFDYSGPFTETVLMGNLAILFAGKKLEWDGENMKVTNLAEANQYVMPEYRSGWRLL